GGGGSRQELLGPPDGLEELYRKAHQRGMRSDIGGNIQGALLGAPAKRRTKVVELDLDPVDGVAPARPVPLLVATRGALSEVCGVPIAHPRQPPRPPPLL